MLRDLGLASFMEVHFAVGNVMLLSDMVDFYSKSIEQIRSR